MSIAPANTEIAFAIGAGDKVVAGTSYDDYPAAAKSLPKIGDFQSPSVEKIVSFQPDLVLATGGIQSGLRAKLENLGIKVFVVDPTTLDGVYADLTALGQLMGVARQGDDARRCHEAARRRRSQQKVGRPDRSRTVFVEIYSKPLMTAGKGTFIDNLVSARRRHQRRRAAGSGFPPFSSEVLLQDNPDVYIATTGSWRAPARSPGAAATAGSRPCRTDASTSSTTTSSCAPDRASSTASSSSPR